MQAAQTIINKFVQVILAPAILVIFSLGMLYFVWGLVQFLIAVSDGSPTADGKRHMIYGVAGMFIMVSVYGIIALISNTFGLGVNPANPGSYNPTPSTSQINFTIPSFGQ